MCIPGSPEFSTVTTFLNCMNPGDGTIASCCCIACFLLFTLTFLQSFGEYQKVLLNTLKGNGESMLSVTLMQRVVLHAFFNYFFKNF